MEDRLREAPSVGRWEVAQSSQTNLYSDMYNEYARGASIPRARRITTRKVGQLSITLELLEELLGFPEDTHITNVWMGPVNNTIGMLVQSPSMPETLEGAEVTTVSLELVRGWDA